MKKYLTIIALLIGTFSFAQSPKMRVLFVDSSGYNQVASGYLPQVAISGYYDNLLHIPSISINGVSQSVTNGASWTVAGSAFTPYIESKSSNYTITSADFPSGYSKVLQLWVDCSGGSYTIALPAYASFTGYKVYVGKLDNTANILTVSGLGYDNIISGQYATKEIFSTGTSWNQN